MSYSYWAGFWSAGWVPLARLSAEGIHYSQSLQQASQYVPFMLPFFAHNSMFGFVTGEPDPLIKFFLPNAMPVILHPEDYGCWLLGEPAETLATPFPSQFMAVQ